mgnify:CR=1 FL=1
MKSVLTIAGSDCSGGAGIQADIKTITVHKMYAMSAITALTAQNTTGVYGVLEATQEFVGQQLDCIFTDIFPDAVKIGMLSDSGIIEVVAAKLQEYGARNIVLDPVMIATSGSYLINKEAIATLQSKLLPLADIITPNIPEAESLTGIKITTREQMLRAARQLKEKIPGYVLIKGGHLPDAADDLLYYSDDDTVWFKSERIGNPNTHGTGCTLSSAIACNLAAGHNMASAVEKAKAYITGAIKANLNLGKGHGPLNHCFSI